jgi:quercetin dioxygenase-like cupin family protein
MDKVEWKPVSQIVPGTSAARTSGGTMAALLSEDPDTGYRTSLLKMPPGWASEAPESHSVDQEHYVLEGSLTTDLDGEPVTLGPGSYRFLPAGQIHGRARSETGCTMLNIEYGEIDMIYHEPTKQVASA